MICLMILIIISCNSTNQYNIDVSGVKLDAFAKRANYVDSIDNRVNDRINYYLEEIFNKNEEIKTEEVSKMDAGIQELITALTSAIAGVYCLVKTILGLIKKIKK